MTAVPLTGNAAKVATLTAKANIAVSRATYLQDLERWAEAEVLLASADRMLVRAEALDAS